MKLKHILFIVVYLTMLSTLKTQTVSTLATSTGINDGLALDEEGNLYGAYYNGSFNGSSVYKVTPNGDVSVFAEGFNCTNGLDFDHSGNLVVVNVSAGNLSQLYKVTPEGVKTTFGPSISGGSGVLVDPLSDTIYVSTYATHEIFKIAPDTTLISFYSGSELNGPVGMAFDENNNFYVANYTSGEVLKIESDGSSTTFLADLPESSFGGAGFLTYASGNLYATGIGVNAIYKIPLTGGLVYFAGTQSTGSEDGEANIASFNHPNGIISNLAGDSLFISDYGTQNIRIITDLDMISDTISPKVETINLLTNTRLEIIFSENLDKSSAENLENIAINNNVVINSASLGLSSKNKLTLLVSELTASNYELTISNIADFFTNEISDTIVEFNNPFSNANDIENYEIKVYPNPVTNNNIFIDSPEIINQIEIYNTAGKLIQKEKINKDKFNLELSDEAHGLLIVKLISFRKKVYRHKIYH